MDDLEKLGPLAALVGDWEGEDGLDVSFNHEQPAVIETPYREKTSFKPFGPVENGPQVLYGLDYRTAAWRGDEEDPFHTEVGYWLWDADAGQVMRGFLVPRGMMKLAGGTATADATEFTMTAELGSETYGVLANPYLVEAAKCVSYEVKIIVAGDTYTYEEDTVLDMNVLPDLVHHTDRNTMRRVG